MGRLPRMVSSDAARSGSAFVSGGCVHYLGGISSLHVFARHHANIAAAALRCTLRTLASLLPSTTSALTQRRRRLGSRSSSPLTAALLQPLFLVQVHKVSQRRS